MRKSIDQYMRSTGLVNVFVYSSAKMSTSMWTFTCMLVLSCGIHLTSETRIQTSIQQNVTVPPLIVEEPEKVIAYITEESIEIVCVATGEPPPVYKWKLNDLDFDPRGIDDRVFIKPGEGTLLFTRPLDRDEGIYQCLAENQAGTALSVRADFRLAFLEPMNTPVTIIYRPLTIDNFTLPCVPPESFPDPEIFWATIDDQGRYVPLQLDDRVSMDPTGNLHFTNVRPEDAQSDNLYVCLVENDIMRRIEEGYYARIEPQSNNSTQIYPMEVMWVNPPNQFALRGDTWRVKCIFSGYPTPVVNWTRIDDNLPEGRWRLESYGQELVIENIQFEDAGSYECQDINEYHTEPIREAVTLAVEAAPYWIQKPQSIEVLEGETVVFTCECDGLPEPVNFWSINGISTSDLPDDPNRIVEAKTMTFLNVSQEDTQVIQCNSTNKHGYQYSNAYLNVLDAETPVLQRSHASSQSSVNGHQDRRLQQANVRHGLQNSLPVKDYTASTRPTAARYKNIQQALSKGRRGFGAQRQGSNRH